MHLDRFQHPYRPLFGRPTMTQLGRHLDVQHLTFERGVFGDDVESVSVMEGNSVTLRTDTKIQNDEVITWKFRQDSIATLNRGKTGGVLPKIKPNEAFKDRLQLNNQTGDLRIMKIRISDSGPYRLEISRTKGLSIKTFDISVSDSGVNSLLVLVGEYFTLQTGVPDIQKYDVIQWRFEHQNTSVAEINRPAGRFYINDDADGIFRQRLHLDYWTGSLTIRNIRTEHSGLYEVDIGTSSSNHIIHKSFNVTVRGEVKSVSVREGESVTLETDIAEIERDDQIWWMFGQSQIAEIYKATRLYYIYDGPDERFRDRLKLDKKTGSLNITNITTEHAGLYDLKISSSRNTINKRFIVTVTVTAVSGSGQSVWIVFAVLLCVAAVGGVIYYRQKFSKLESKTLKSVYATEGMDVVLETDVKVHRGDLIMWMFKNTIIKATVAAMPSRTSPFDSSDKILNEEGTLELDKTTGFLTIKNIKTTHAGFYDLKIQRNNNSSSFKSFKLSVFGILRCRSGTAASEVAFRCIYTI
ncbi:uncharacterized protein [Chanodichthys erythropterus]|uniref:uncharacterized protein isoform X2 n=1 Tax=Chanodichthys erythropterus TaxID=933992 RepID=UPI00351F10C5